MQLLNYRKGFATNSSSSHSIIWVANPNEFEDNDLGLNGSFNWEYFTLKNRESKTQYLAALIVEALQSMGVTSEVAVAMASSYMGIDPLDRYAGVDHQSEISIPIEAIPHKIDELPLNIQFINELEEVLMDDHVIIFGGNDNDEPHNDIDRALNGGRRLNFTNIEELYGSYIARKDGDVWTFFDRNKGDKVRFSFNDVDDFSDYKPSAPELVDLKITNRCEKKCKFCYQHSSKTGKHAPLSVINTIAKEFGKHTVFEVAIGGGEPLGYDDNGSNICDVINLFSANGVTSNITTGSMPLLLKYKDFLFANCGGVGYSITTEKDWYDLLEEYGKDKTILTEGKLVIHIPVQITPLAIIDKIYEFAVESKCKLNILFLGYKKCNVPEAYSCDALLSVFKALVDNRQGCLIGIDTCLANQIQPFLHQMKIPSWSYYVKEGVNSMYIDAVTKSYGESSFTENMTPIKAIEKFDLSAIWKGI